MFIFYGDESPQGSVCGDFFVVNALDNYTTILVLT